MQVRLKDLSPREQAVALAWLIAGEGCITLSHRPYRRMEGECYEPYLGITNGNRDMITQVVDVLGGAVKENTNASRGFRPCYEWSVNRRTRVLDVLETVLPYLPAKREQAELVIRFCRMRLNTKPKNLPYGDEERSIYVLIRKLNAGKGPKRTYVPGPVIRS